MELQHVDNKQIGKHFKFYVELGFQTQGLGHARQALYH